MRQFPLEFLQSRAGSNLIVPGEFGSHPFSFFIANSLCHNELVLCPVYSVYYSIK